MPWISFRIETPVDGQRFLTRDSVETRPDPAPIHVIVNLTIEDKEAHQVLHRRSDARALVLQEGRPHEQLV